MQLLGASRWKHILLPAKKRVGAKKVACPRTAGGIKVEANPTFSQENLSATVSAEEVLWTLKEQLRWLVLLSLPNPDLHSRKRVHMEGYEQVLEPRLSKIAL
eukprot:1156950-Pelagomonas_calceolata.AAC.3